MRTLLLFIIVGLSSEAYTQIEDEKHLTLECSINSIKNSIQVYDTFKEKGKVDSVRTILLNALQCAKKLNQRDSEAFILLCLGKNEFKELGPRDAPTEYFLESLKIYSELKDKEGIANCNLQLGVLYYDIRNFESAVSHFQDVLRNTDNERTLKLSYYLSALSYSELNSFSNAENMFELALERIQPTDSVLLLEILAFKGKMYINKGETERGIELLKETMLQHQEIIKKEDFTPILAFLSTAYYKTKKYDKAIYYGRLAYDKTKGKSKGAHSVFLRESESTLNKSYKAIGNIDSAYFFLKAISELDEFMANNEVLQRVTQMNGQFEFEQKMKLQRAAQELKDKLAEKDLERQKLLTNLTLIGLFLVGMFALVFFRQRIKISREKLRSDKLLLNILPEKIAQELKDKGKAEAQHFKQASILFTDFKGFTEQSEKLTAAELVSEINYFFEAFDHIVEEYNVEKIKTIGDAYMAVGGLPIPTEHSVKNTVLAAIEMQKYIAKRKALKAAQGEDSFLMRIGIHTGPVVAGIVGIKKFQYDIWGDAVNTASRLESKGEANEVNISNTTYEHLKNDSIFTFENRGMISVKGKGEIQMWFVRLVEENE